ncbi:MAG TPA: tetratricopeptide repeat protein [Patescibacteria group bacterium]
MIEKTAAIEATLKGNWDDAIVFNLQLLKENPKDIETLNRLAFAYAAAGKIKEAKAAYQEVLKLDEINSIALKNLKRLGEVPAKKVQTSNFLINNNMFLEEVGKTKLVSLVNTAPSKTLRALQVGQPLELVIKRLKIFVLDQNKQFIGMLPDNISRRLIKFMNGGNKYDAYVRAGEEHTVTIFIKEIKRVTRFKDQPSFVVGDIQKQTLVVSKKKKDYELESEEETSEE